MPRYSRRLLPHTGTAGGWCTAAAQVKDEVVRSLGIRSKLLCYWQQTQVVAEVSSEEVVLDSEVLALCTANEWLLQELDS